MGQVRETFDDDPLRRLGKAMKLAKDLEPGDRVRMADGTVKTVADIARGAATFVMEDGKRKRGVMIGWKGRDEFSTVPADQPCWMEGDDG